MTMSGALKAKGRGGRLGRAQSPRTSASVVVKWNGKDLPDELRSMPTGRYVLVAIDDGGALSAPEERGLEKALSSVAAGRGLSAAEARKRISSRLRP